MTSLPLQREHRVLIDLWQWSGLQQLLLSMFMVQFSPSLKQLDVFPKYQNLFFSPRRSLYILMCKLLVIFDAPFRKPFSSVSNGTLIFYICLSCYSHAYLVPCSHLLHFWPEEHRGSCMSVLPGLWSQKQCALEHRVEQLYTCSKTDWLLSAFPQAKDCLSTLQGPQDKAAGSVPHGFSEPARRQNFGGAWIWWWSVRGGLWGRILSKWQLSMHIFRG